MDGNAHPQTRRIVCSKLCEEATYLQKEQKSEIEVCEIEPETDVVEMRKRAFQQRIEDQYFPV